MDKTLNKRWQRQPERSLWPGLGPEAPAHVQGRGLALETAGRPEPGDPGAEHRGPGRGTASPVHPKSSTAHQGCPWGQGVCGVGRGRRMILEGVEGEKGSEETPAQE